MSGHNPELGSYYEFGKELIEKIQYYLVHEEERERIAAAGYKRAQEEHSYKRRFEEMVKTMGLIA